MHGYWVKVKLHEMKHNYMKQKTVFFIISFSILCDKHIMNLQTYKC